jgi:hypothetical protein
LLPSSFTLASYHRSAARAVVGGGGESNPAT